MKNMMNFNSESFPNELSYLNDDALMKFFLWVFEEAFLRPN